MSGELDIGEAAAYISGERPGLDENHVWAVLNEIRRPPPAGSDGLAEQLISGTHPEISPRDIKLILAEWRAYADIAGQRDWDDDELDYVNRFDDD